jgi:hypothetical protein
MSMTHLLRFTALAAFSLSCAPAQDEKWTSIFNGKVVKHLINGKVVFEYTDTKLNPAEAEAKALIEAQGHNNLTEGYISLQSESHPYEFRNIEVLELKP